MKDLIRLMRPAQWIKNIFVIMPVFFAGEIIDAADFWSAVVLFMAFSLMSSAVYCINDIVDRRVDAVHPRKCSRPVASGRVSVWKGVALAILLACVSLVLPFLRQGICRLTADLILLGYLILNIAYSLGLKKIAILDVFLIAFGFVLRVACGGLGCGIWLSPWIIIMTFLLTLLIAFGKRRDDVVIFERSNVLVRKNISAYNLPFLNATLVLLAAVTMVSYILYTVSDDVSSRFGCDYIYLSSVFVLAGILRYLQIAIVGEKSGSPTEMILKDRFLQVCCVLWMLFFIIVIYVV